MTEDGFTAKRILTDLLSAVPAMGRVNDREAIIKMFRDRGYELPELAAESVRILCYNLIDSLASQPGTLQQLADTVRWADKSVLAEKFFDEVRRQLPGDFFSLDDRLEFVADIRKLIRPDELHMYYRQVVGDECLEVLADAGDLTRELEELNLEEPCHALIMLTEEVALKANKLKIRRRAGDLSERLARYIDTFNADKTNEQQLRLAALRRSRRKRDRASPGAEHASLVVLLDPYVPKPSAGYLLNVWLYHSQQSPDLLYAGDEPASLYAVQEEVARQLRKTISRLSRPGSVADIDLEFFLPRDLLDHPIEDWVVSEGNVTLGTLYVVVIRDRDRLYNPLLWPSWQQKWRQVASSEGSPSGPFSRWITCMDEPCRSGELYPILLSTELVSLGFTFPPPPGARRLELAEALNAGTPIAVWPRARCAHPVPARAADACQGVSFRDSLSQELAGRRPAELPNLVLQLRRTRAAVGDLGLALLWDDPNRCPIPDPGDARLDAPAYRPQNRGDL